MAKQYNLYNFEAEFRQYLIAGNKSPVSIKNYLSDLRHFIGWISAQSQSKGIEWKIENISASDIKDYKDYLTSNQIPHKTINRRLSTVRKFGSFCITQGWINENPARDITNIDRFDDTTEEIVKKYEAYLHSQRHNSHFIKSSLNDLEELFQFSNL